MTDRRAMRPCEYSLIEIHDLLSGAFSDFPNIKIGKVFRCVDCDGKTSILITIISSDEVSAFVDDVVMAKLKAFGMGDNINLMIGVGSE